MQRADCKKQNKWQQTPLSTGTNASKQQARTLHPSDLFATAWKL